MPGVPRAGAWALRRLAWSVTAGAPQLARPPAAAVPTRPAATRPAACRFHRYVVRHHPSRQSLAAANPLSRSRPGGWHGPPSFVPYRCHLFKCEAHDLRKREWRAEGGIYMARNADRRRAPASQRRGRGQRCRAGTLKWAGRGRVGRGRADRVAPRRRRRAGRRIGVIGGGGPLRGGVVDASPNSGGVNPV